MTTFATKVLLAASLLSLAALRTAAAADIIDTSDPAVVLAMVKAYGDATSDKNTDGDPIITGTMDSKAYVIFFEGCTGGKACQSLRFYSRWNDSPLTLEQINDYNGRGISPEQRSRTVPLRFKWMFALWAVQPRLISTTQSIGSKAS